MVSFSSSQENVLIGIAITFSTFSFIASSSVAFTFHKFRELQSFEYNIVLWAVLANLGADISVFLGNPDDGSFLCGLQGFTHTYFNLVSIFCIVSICHIMRLKFVSFDQHFERHHREYTAFAIGLPLVLAILPLTTSSYGDAGGWCGINQTTEIADMDSLWRLLVYYLPIFSAFIYALVTVTSVATSIALTIRSSSQRNSFSRGENENDDEDDEESSLLSEASYGSTGSSGSRGSSFFLDPNYLITSRKLWAYPALLLFCFGPTFLIGVIWLFEPTLNVYGLYLLQYLCSCLFGVGLALVLGVTPRVRALWARHLERYPHDWSAIVFSILCCAEKDEQALFFDDRMNPQRGSESRRRKKKSSSKKKSRDEQEAEEDLFSDPEDSGMFFS